MGGEKFLMEVNKPTTLEVAARIPPIRLQQFVTKKKPGGCEQLGNTRGTRPMHAGHDEHR